MVAVVPLVRATHVRPSRLSSRVALGPPAKNLKSPYHTAVRSVVPAGLVAAGTNGWALTPVKIAPPSPTVATPKPVRSVPAAIEFRRVVPSGAPGAQVAPATVGTTTWVGAPGPPAPRSLRPLMVKEYVTPLRSPVMMRGEVEFGSATPFRLAQFSVVMSVPVPKKIQ